MPRRSRAAICSASAGRLETRCRWSGGSGYASLVFRTDDGTDVITNFGGGNTSAKIPAEDPVTSESVTVLWVKGSGGDLGTIKRGGFATLYQDKLESLKRRYRGVEHEDEIVDLYPLCTFGNAPRAGDVEA